MNRWMYGYQNPIINTDPTGLCSQDYWGWDDASGLFTDANCNALDADSSPYDFTKQWYTQLASQMRKDGLSQAATNMEHFLDGSGTDVTLSSAWVQQTITSGMPKIKKDIDKLVKWWVRKYYDSLETCVEVPIVAGNVLSTTWTTKEGYTPSYWKATSKDSPVELTDVAAALGTFRVDIEIGGNLHRKPGGFLSSDFVDANLQIKVVIMDIYDWHPGLWVTYPRRENKILDAWAHRLEVSQGTPDGYLASGEYIYTESLLGIRKGILSNSPPDPWIVTSCIGSRFDIDGDGNGSMDYCDYKGYPRITPP